MKKFNCLIWVVSAMFAGKAWGQAPTIPNEVQARGESARLEARKQSDAAFEKALPVIRAEARKGDRPYIPWASSPDDLPQCRLRAFPGAEGAGAFTKGGRGGKVIVVTSLEDSGPGTFREACETGGARIIVFNVAGVIRLKSPLYIRAPYVTIAGQTAPGDGICVTGETVNVDTHDVIIRHMRFRRGNPDLTSCGPALGGEPVGNIIYDHVSASWGSDNNLTASDHRYKDMNGKTFLLVPVNMTVQNCICSEALDMYDYAPGAKLGGRNVSFVRNLWASNRNCNPEAGDNDNFHFVNNVIHNWCDGTVKSGSPKGTYTLVNNYYKPGPATPRKGNYRYQLLYSELPEDSTLEHRWGKIYTEGNVTEGNNRVTRNNWSKGIQFESEPTKEEYMYIRLKEPPKTAPAVIMTAKTAYDYVLANAGANIPRRDTVDTRIVRQVQTGKIEYVQPDSAGLALLADSTLTPSLPADSYKQGIIYDISQVGGIPSYTGTPYKDSDKDGMPDEWEAKYGLNPNDPSDANGDVNGDGYTNIEKYINGIDPSQKVDWYDPSNNYDTLAEKKTLM